MIHRFRIVPTGDTTCETYIDDKKVRCRSIDVRYRIDEIPTVDIDVIGTSELDVQAEVNMYSTDAIGNSQLLEIVAKRFEQPEFLLGLKRKLDEWAKT